MEQTQSPLEFYNRQIASLRPELKRLDRQSALLSWLRLAVMVALAGCIYRAINDGDSGWLLAGALPALVVFLVLVYTHAVIAGKRQFTNSLLLINTREAAYAGNGELFYDDGSAYTGTHHAFTYDLDIFGPGSLYRHINRTVTAAGSRILAGILSGFDRQLILQRQEAINELAAMPGWRQQFSAHGMKVTEQPGDLATLEKWLQQPAPQPGLLIKLLMYLLPAAIVVVLAAGSFTSFDAWWPFTYLFIANLLLTASQAGAIRRQHARLEKVMPVLAARVPMLKMIEQTGFNSALLSQWRQQLHHPPAAEAVSQLAGLLERFDRLFNVVASVVTNGLFQYHNHAMLKLARWKHQYGSYTLTWLQHVAAFDAMNSMAGFAFNNPAYTYPVIIETHTCLNAVQLGHPLIPASKRVCNDIGFEKQRFYVLTGSNMAGKSTFLRTLGVSIVLANAGMPVCAQQFEYSPFRLFSSMRIDDSLADSESYFYAELKRLQSLITGLGNGGPWFVLLDEVLRGTNSEDKYSGTTGLLRQLMELGAWGVLATHDTKVSLLEKAYNGAMSNICFEAETVNGQLRFDYRLRPGVSVHKSATQLMLQMGIIPAT